MNEFNEKYENPQQNSNNNIRKRSTKFNVFSY